MVGLHNQVNLSFLIVGHTKFSPDWCFGLLKQRFRRTKVSCLSDLEQVVNRSAEANIAQLVGTQCGEVVVPTYNWSALYTGRLKKLKGIKKYHHFTITSTTPGSVCVKTESDSDEEHISLLTDHTWAPSQHNLPPVVVPSGLSIERQWYLHNHIAQYCQEEVRDVVCPQPLNPLPGTSAPLPPTTTPLPGTSAPLPTTTTPLPPTTTLLPTTTPLPPTTTLLPTTTTPLPGTSTPLPATTSGTTTSTVGTAAEHQPPAKRARVCGKCKTPGHNARTCGKWRSSTCFSPTPSPLLHFSTGCYYIMHIHHYMSCIYTQPKHYYKCNKRIPLAQPIHSISA